MTNQQQEISVMQKRHSNHPLSQKMHNVPLVRNVLLIWFDSNSDKNNDDCQYMITQLRCVVNTINTFTDVDQCMDFLTDNYNEETLMVISDALSQQTVPLIHDITQLHRIFLSFA
jgi:hypothetical protein